LNLNQSASSYQIAGTNVLTSTALGSSVVSSSLTSVGTLSGGLNIATGQTYKINSTNVLTSTALGSSVVSSSLTSVGTLSGGLNIATGQSYKVNSVDVLTSTTLGSTVTSCSLSTINNSSMVVIGNQTNGTKSFLEIGLSTTNNTTFLDFHSQNNGTADYDTRILSSGGSTGSTAGQGTLQLYGYGLYLCSDNIITQTSYSSGLAKLFGSQYVLVNTAYTLVNNTTDQTLLPSGATTLTTTASTWYRFEGRFHIHKSVGTSVSTLSLGFHTSSNITNIQYNVIAEDSASTGSILGSVTNLIVATTSNTVITASMTSYNQHVWWTINGTFSSGTGGGTFKPTIQFSAAQASGSLFTVKTGSYMSVTALGPSDGGNISVGFA
jgi:hypothetical protein